MSDLAARIARSIDEGEAEMQSIVEGTCRICGHGIATAHDAEGECWKPGCDCTSEAPDG